MLYSIIVDHVIGGHHRMTVRLHFIIIIILLIPVYSILRISRSGERGRRAPVDIFYIYKAYTNVYRSGLLLLL